MYSIDISEELWSKRIIEILLIDRTTNRNILWATEDYEHISENFNSHFPIEIYQITGRNSNLIKPRVSKNIDKQGRRRKEKAEVFTPSWICNKQNNLIDDAWFDKENVFNKADIESWITNTEKIVFPKHKSWQKYVDDIRMEIACGEAPYLVSRYDTVTGELIEVKNRIGLLDRKLRVVHENTTSEKEWLFWSQRAFESIYGFEFQGDNLLLARENLLITYIDYMGEKLRREPTEAELKKIASIISWNIWQMDGLTYTIPYHYKKNIIDQVSFFEQDTDNDKDLITNCRVKDWRSKKIIDFSEMIQNGGV